MSVKLGRLYPETTQTKAAGERKEWGVPAVSPYERIQRHTRHVLHSFPRASEFPSGDSVFAMGDMPQSDLDIDLTNPKLGEELLKDAQGDLPINVWKSYFWQHDLVQKPVLAWWVDPDHPDVAPIDPQQAVDQAEPLVAEVIKHLMSDSPQEALEAAKKAIGILVHGSSDYQRGRGQAPKMQHQAVRAWVIREFNPHPTKRDESKVLWRELADKLFKIEGKCPRTIRDESGNTVCGKSRHDSDSPCVKALHTAVSHLESAMERDGVPTNWNSKQ
jgi:hypothetical protein